MQSFYLKQTNASKEKYKKLLKGIAQTSRIYSDNPKPLIHYRAVENIFCRSFEALNCSRQDVSVDAVKDRDGIGVKTFLSNGPLKYEKIAEFNDRSKYPLNYRNNLKLVQQIADYRNTRIKTTVKKYQLNNCVYHYVVRDIRRLLICECPLQLINLQSIKLDRIQRTGHVLRFTDGIEKYYFHLTKNTLYKAFKDEKPYDSIEVTDSVDINLLTEVINELSGGREKESQLSKYDYVILPLYSTRNGEVPEKSGLNQWNAGGRARHADEVYIPIPKVVHRTKRGFFPKRDEKFKLTTLDGKEFIAKVCQDNSKALMSDPNKELGKWILRDILKIPHGGIVTYEYLRKKNADTVIIYKISEDHYQIALHSFGAFNKAYKEDSSK